MKRARRRLVTAAAIVLLGTDVAGSRAACTLDQEQAVYDGGTSARTLPGYTVWQSFTPSVAGSLCRIDMGFFNDMAGEGELRIREGEGTAGAILQSLIVPVVGFTIPGVSWNAWDVDVQVSAGVTYTFELVPDAATLPDPYGVAIGASNPYPFGVMGLDDPSGSYPTGFDVDFRTYVDGGSITDVEVYRNAAPAGLATPANVIATPPGPPHDDVAPPAVPLLCYQVGDGSGGLEVVRVSKLPDGVRITWP